jgi:hypothetical protein
MEAWTVANSLCHVFRARWRIIVGCVLCTGVVWLVVALTQHTMPGCRATLALAGFVHSASNMMDQSENER